MPRLTHVVVLPTPPFWFAIHITLPICCSFLKSVVGLTITKACASMSHADGSWALRAHELSRRSPYASDPYFDWLWASSHQSPSGSSAHGSLLRAKRKRDIFQICFGKYLSADCVLLQSLCDFYPYQPICTNMRAKFLCTKYVPAELSRSVTTLYSGLLPFWYTISCN